MAADEQASPPGFEELLVFLRDERGFDFTGYKRASLMRRITKRMQTLRIDDFDAYLGYLAAHDSEFVDLFNTILINVTGFFRDDDVWRYLEDEVVPELVANADGRALRIWSTGCASGEEAFTLAMLFAEAMGEDAFRALAKIYATDVDDEALAEGRHATYTAKQIEPVPDHLREKYFEPLGARFVFRPDLRRSVIFGRHDLVQDPPISRIDLLVSRNTLMYFNIETQRRILQNFHFSLLPTGYLFLGKSEVLAARTNLFRPVDLKRRVFAKVPAARDDRPRLAVPDDRPPADVADAAVRASGFEFAPTAQVVVDRSGRILAVNLIARTMFGLSNRDVGRLLQDLELSYRPVELRSRIEQAYSERHPVSVRDVEWRTGAEVRFLDVQVAPLVASRGELLGVGISFNDVTRYRQLQGALQDSKRDLEAAYEDLQSTVEELETTNEELQSTNEELETTNEELQSTNEELETMNEELQSTNEELETMNDELQQRTTELNSVNAFLESVLGSIEAGVVVLDDELKIEAWNAGAFELWGLRPEEVRGRPFLDLDIGLPTAALQRPIAETLGGGSPAAIVLEAVNRRGQTIQCSVKLAPLDGSDGRRRGVILLMGA